MLRIIKFRRKIVLFLKEQIFSMIDSCHQFLSLSMTKIGFVLAFLSVIIVYCSHLLPFPYSFRFSFHFTNTHVGLGSIKMYLFRKKSVNSDDLADILLEGSSLYNQRVTLCYILKDNGLLDGMSFIIDALVRKNISKLPSAKKGLQNVHNIYYP